MPLKLVKNKTVDNINQNVVEQVEKQARTVISIWSPGDQKLPACEVEQIMEDLTQDNQKLFMTTITMRLFLSLKEQLDKYTGVSSRATAERFIHADVLSEQQELGFDTCLPLCCYNRVRWSVLNTTGVWLPFSVKELDAERRSVLWPECSIPSADPVWQKECKER